MFSTESIVELADIDVEGAFARQYDDAIVYGEYEQETVLHEGAIRLLANGWVELPSGRLLSPNAVHHIDQIPDADD